MREDTAVVIDYLGNKMRFDDLPDGVVPCRFSVGDKVRGSRHTTDRIETVEAIHWHRTVWHSIEPYWYISTDCSGGSQSSYWLHSEKEDESVEAIYIVEAKMVKGNWKAMDAYTTRESAQQWIDDKSVGRFQIVYRIRDFIPAKGEKDAT